MDKFRAKRYIFRELIYNHLIFVEVDLGREFERNILYSVHEKNGVFEKQSKKIS